MKLQLPANSTDVSIILFIQDATSTTGEGLTGLVYNSSGLSCYYVKRRGPSTQLSLASLGAANSGHTDGGFVEIDSTNLPGFYRLDLSDAMFTNSEYVVGMLKGAADMAPVAFEICLINDSNLIKILNDTDMAFTFYNSLSRIIFGEVTGFQTTTNFECDLHVDLLPTDGNLNGRILIFTNGDLVNLACKIVGSENTGGVIELTVETFGGSALPSAPGTDSFIII